MANTIEYAKIFQLALDAAAVEQATSGWMEVNRDLVRYSGGDEVKIPNVVMDGLADYDRANGFVAGSVDLSWQTMKMTKDRGRSFQIDENDVDESGFVLAAASLMGEFQRVHVVPEIDAYRYSTIAQKCMGSDLAAYSYTPAESSILKALLDDIAAVQDVVGESIPLIVSISTLVLNLLNNSDKLSRRLDVTDFSQGDVTVKVKSLNGIPLRSVPSSRMKSKYVFQDGKTAGQEKGGFKAAEDAIDINWLITPQNAPIAVSKTDKMRIFDPETNQKARAWGWDYRRYHDLWITKEKLKTCRANFKQAKPASVEPEETA
ncbi:hypothetical protein [Enterocloster bolteae]|uniref:hypothetical protein n=1 Tax=Enterocloster bolteae TaxID=208479 RepID=UPI001D07D7E0|nr:hypothetical protein [Enterocloster bolteae]MCB6803503.1 hypothetical protein [Enterocloster bolteae]MCB7236810.1 hypothetical protein [Enterocloster bolteae]MCG4949025.1 hypothetical protein [Enterocloster bolteae]MCG4954978.1 hypothetical protein [Enterocloster bolteae]